MNLVQDIVFPYTCDKPSYVVVGAYITYKGLGLDDALAPSLHFTPYFLDISGATFGFTPSKIFTSRATLKIKTFFYQIRVKFKFGAQHDVFLAKNEVVWCT